MSRDPFTLEIVKDALVAIGHEMFDAMIRTSMSPIVYETTDFAVGVTDARGNLIAQGNGVTAFSRYARHGGAVGLATLPGSR